MNNNDNKFEYTYSAKRQEELEKIRSKYIPKEEDKMEELRRLDKSVTKPGTAWSIVIGIIGLKLGGDFTVNNAVVIAQTLGISEKVIRAAINYFEFKYKSTILLIELLLNATNSHISS